MCSNSQETSAQLNRVSTSQSLSEFVAGLTPDGWNLFDKVGLFTADNLYERINGRAELYLSYDVTELTTATFEKEADIGEFIELSIFDMGNPTNAFGIFSVERFLGETPLDLGRLSYRSGSNVYIWKGKYYITLVASETTEKLRLISLGLASKVAASLGDSSELVWGLSTLPQDDLIPDSIQYFKVDALGLDFMKNTYTAKYLKRDTEVTVFLSQLDSSDTALNTMKSFAEQSDKYGRGSTHEIKNDIEFFLCDMNGTYDVIFKKGRLVGGVLSVTHKDIAIEAAYDFWKQLGNI